MNSNSKRTGVLISIQDSLVKARYNENVIMGETAEILVEGKFLQAEVLQIVSDPKNAKLGIVEMQVFEDLTGAKIGDLVVFKGKALSVLLGPGLLTSIWDGLQNALYPLGKQDSYLKPGMRAPALDEEKLWDFTPMVKPGDTLYGGHAIGSVPEGRFIHKILVPFGFGKCKIQTIIESSLVNITQTVAIVTDEHNKEHELKLVFSHPVKSPIPFMERSIPKKTISTGVRVIDLLAPVAYGGTVGNPGPFGAGKTVLQHSLCKYALADIIIMAACGERAGEAVEVFKDFAELDDPSTGESLMNRMCIFGNTSSMPVAAREASVFIALTVGEYYRYQGYNVILLADSTSRWAQALRERSGRQGDIPGPEAFPMDIPDQIKGMYQRAGADTGSGGSLTFIGTVSPAGGNFQEPVTQATMDSTGGFWGLSQDRADAKKYPAIDSLVYTNSVYDSFISKEDRDQILKTLQEANDIDQTISTIGLKKVPVEKYVLYQKGQTIDFCVLQQDAFHELDACTRPERLQVINMAIQKLIKTPIHFSNEEGDVEELKEQIKTEFDQLRLWWKDWNANAKSDAELAGLPEQIENFVLQEQYA
ncbi:V-type ATP synthase subunit A [Ancylomarina sp. 16SWW S1-10-2]|uniref:V-type ATP synthase subunit A n=1 Tax=Ancylomarina sp. 16SWW S1-10-2 TaxID=2499681 RepID=UPI0012AEAF78|nr:V-type ATP synthase subunit A [Ancylomarina sp. 16SWW S1-10-2]MRT92960.1 V-type ATP synthase subunit A [Ancylomarina sp. 16SWW S1-10-2]